MAVSIPHLSRHNMIVIGTCLAVVLVAVILGPALQIVQKTSLERRISEARSRIENLTRASELRRQLGERLAGLQTTAGVQPVVFEPLSSGEADQVLADLRRLAENSGILLADVRPDLESMGQDSETMLIGATMYGTMSGFQTMLGDLLEVGYLDRLQRIVLEPEAQGLRLETDFSVQVR